MADEVLDRITYDPGAHEAGLAPIPWPAGLEPRTRGVPHQSASVPLADVLVITWTAAEARALADVLTPGIQSAEWAAYDTGWASYAPQLTGRSPARDEGRLASWCMTQVGGLAVTCVKSELHPATDGPTLPTAQLAAQLAGECSPRLVITTGTAGGAGDGTLLGDINVARAVRADFTSRLKDHPWSKGTWRAAPVTTGQGTALAGTAPLIAANAGRIPAQPRPPRIWAGDTVSTDTFAYDTQDDHFGLRAYDPAIRAVEMDDAAICAGINGRVPVASCRNASDPVLPSAGEANAREAASIYQRFGYWTSINSAICTWALIAGMSGDQAI